MGLETGIFENGTASFSRTAPTDKRGPPLEVDHFLVKFQTGLRRSIYISTEMSGNFSIMASTLSLCDVGTRVQREISMQSDSKEKFGSRCDHFILHKHCFLKYQYTTTQGYLIFTKLSYEAWQLLNINTTLLGFRSSCSPQDMC